MECQVQVHKLLSYSGEAVDMGQPCFCGGKGQDAYIRACSDAVSLVASALTNQRVDVVSP